MRNDGRQVGPAVITIFSSNEEYTGRMQTLKSPRRQKETYQRSSPSYHERAPSALPPQRLRPRLGMGIRDLDDSLPTRPHNSRLVVIFNRVLAVLMIRRGDIRLHMFVEKAFSVSIFPSVQPPVGFDR